MKKYSNYILLFLMSFIWFVNSVNAAQEISDFQYFMHDYGIAICFAFLLVIIIVLLLSHDEWNFGSQRESGEIRFGDKGNILPDYKDIKYFRDIPFSDDLSIAYWICLKYDIVLEPQLKKGLMGAVILKWIKEEKINIIETEKGLFSIKDNNYVIDLSKLKNLSNPIEKSFGKLLLEIAGHNKILEANEFQNWCYHNYSKLSGWFKQVKYNGLRNLKNAGYITNSVEKVNANYGAKKTIVINNVSDNLWYEALKIKGLKKFLLYFTLMNEKEYYNVHLWENYLIFSSLLDVSTEVKEQFGNIYPKLDGESIFNNDSVNYGIGLAEIGYVSFEKGYEEALKAEGSDDSNEQ